MVSKNSKYTVGDCFVKTDTGAIYKIIKASFIDSAVTSGRESSINTWLYDCKTVHGDVRPYVRYYEFRLDNQFYQVPDDSNAVVELYGSV